jgi:prolyl-tRNA synthetase
MGALIMAHSDDNGLVLPPKLAPIQVVIVPIFKSGEELQAISEKAAEIIEKLDAVGISVKFDGRDTFKPGWKFAEYELKGVPVRIAIGPRDLQNNTLEVARRDTLTKESIQLDQIDLAEKIQTLLADIQSNIFQKAKRFMDEKTTVVDTWEEFVEVLENKGGFVSAHWDGTAETEERIKEKTKATIRCIPLDRDGDQGNCILSGKPSVGRVLFAKAY